MVNKVILIGNLGQDPEVRTTGGGMPVATLRLATAERRKGADGNWADHTEWHTVVAFGKTAENVQRFCKKGKQLFIEGKLSTRKWQDKNGQDRWTTEVVADNVRFLGGGREGGGEFGGEPGGGSGSGGGGWGGGGGGGGGGGARGGTGGGAGGRSGGGGYGGGGGGYGGGGGHDPGPGPGGDVPFSDDDIPF